MPAAVPESPRPEVFLLLKAIQALPADERDQVLAWLLYRPDSILPRHPTGRGDWLSAGYGALASTVFDPATMRKARASALVPSGMQLVPIPLPAEIHDKLRDWCQEHSFTLATVISGLVSQFLDSRRPPAAAASE